MEQRDIAVILVDRAPLILYASPGVAALGWVESELVGRRLHDLIGDIRVADEADHPSVRARRSSGTASATRPDGSTQDVDVHAYATSVEGFGPASVMIISPST